MTDSRLALRSQLSDACLYDSLHEGQGWRLVQWKSNSALGHLVSFEIARIGALDGRGHRVKADVVFPRGTVYERSSIEPESGNPVAQTLDGSGGCAANCGAHLLELLSSIVWQRCEVGSHLHPCLPGVIP